jgi:hypothetical protein
VDFECRSFVLDDLAAQEICEMRILASDWLPFDSHVIAEEQVNGSLRNLVSH